MEISHPSSTSVWTIPLSKINVTWILCVFYNVSILPCVSYNLIIVPILPDHKTSHKLHWKYTTLQTLYVFCYNFADMIKDIKFPQTIFPFLNSSLKIVYFCKFKRFKKCAYCWFYLMKINFMIYIWSTSRQVRQYWLNLPLNTNFLSIFLYEFNFDALF